VREDVRGRIDAARDAFEAGRRAARETRQGDLRPRRPVGPPMDEVADEDLDTEV
jgi:hypothetical protein